MLQLDAPFENKTTSTVKLRLFLPSMNLQFHTFFTALLVTNVLGFTTTTSLTTMNGPQLLLMAKSTLFAKKKKTRKKKSRNSDNMSTVEVHETSSAANRPMATLSGVRENHSYEQFFYNEQSTQKIYQLVTRYSKPLLLCNPSLAVLADDDGIEYLLLDRDKRFDFLKSYKEFSLTEPFLVQYPYDSIFIDPPFANVSVAQLVKCFRLMAAKKERLSVPVFIAYNSKREDDLLKAFNELLPECPTLTRLFPLNYRSVREDMQDNIYLYGPKVL